MQKYIKKIYSNQNADIRCFQAVLLFPSSPLTYNHRQSDKQINEIFISEIPYYGLPRLLAKSRNDRVVGLLSLRENRRCSWQSIILHTEKFNNGILKEV